MSTPADEIVLPKAILSPKGILQSSNKEFSLYEPSIAPRVKISGWIPNEYNIKTFGLE